MAIHTGTMVSVDLPNGKVGMLPRFCKDAEKVAVVEVQGKEGEVSFVVGSLIRDAPGEVADPRWSPAFGDLKKFSSPTEWGEFWNGLDLDYETPAKLEGWMDAGSKSKNPGLFLKDYDRNLDLHAYSWEEACKISGVKPLVVSEKLMFGVDVFGSSGAVQYTATPFALSLADEKQALFIPCNDVQEKYKKDVEAGMSVEEARKVALDDSNNCLDDFSAWSNGGEVYGVVVNLLNERGELQEEVSAGWGYVDAEYAEQALASELFPFRAAALAVEIGLDPQLTQGVNLNSGNYIGKVCGVDQENGIVVQSVGMGKWVVHNLSVFGRSPEVGKLAEVKYKDGKGAVVEKTLGKEEKDLGR